MKNLICMILIVFLPLTLTSQTQHRFQVYVSVEGNDKTITNILTSHLKRELRALGILILLEKMTIGDMRSVFFMLRLKPRVA